MIKDIVLVTGDREWGTMDEENVIREALNELLVPSLIIHGDARGADKMAASVGIELGHYVSIFPALWGRDGKPAGPLRNKVMVEIANVLMLDYFVHVYAFHNNIEESKGTKDCINRAFKENMSITIYSTNAEPRLVTAKIP
jgi:hypothetical protein